MFHTNENLKSLTEKINFYGILSVHGVEKMRGAYKENLLYYTKLLNRMLIEQGIEVEIPPSLYANPFQLPIDGQLIDDESIESKTLRKALGIESKEDAITRKAKETADYLLSLQKNANHEPIKPVHPFKLSDYKA